MQLSRYTFRFAVDQGAQTLLYQPLTGAMDVVPTSALASLDSLRRDGPGGLADKTLDYLLQRGYAYRTAEDEEAALARGYEEFLERERRALLRFVVIPTYQCNARCPYCFIGHAIGAHDLMDDRTMDLAFAGMDAIAAERGEGRVWQLSVFGGEALIDTPPQRRTIERILRMGSERRFLLDVVSNGFDLAAYAGLLRAYDVAKVQVTFDGPRDYHNSRRRAVDGKGESFDRIVAGIDAALAAGLALNVRILLDRNSIGQLPELVAFFKERGWFGADGFSVHIGSIFDCFRCQPKKERAKHLGVREGNEILLDLCRRDRSIADLLAIDWQGVRRFLYTGQPFLPTYKSCFGGTRMFAFDLKGGIYACETTAGREEYRVGTFAPTFALDRAIIAALEQRNIFNIPACRNCQQALLCGGGCTFNAVVTNGSLLGPGCRLLKETLQYGFDYYWPEIAARMAEPAGEQPPAPEPVSAPCCASARP
jgi:uncharacterized protein